MIQHATVSDHGAIQLVFKQHASILPYFRHDYLERKIAAGSVIWESGVCIIYHQYKANRQLGVYPGHVRIAKGDIMVSEIVTQTLGSGAAGALLERFFQEFRHTVWLTVRVDNQRACAFYEKHHMTIVGSIAWSGGTIPGRIYNNRPAPATLDFPTYM